MSLAVVATKTTDPIHEAIETHIRACLVADILLRSLEVANSSRKSLVELRELADDTFDAIMKEFAAGTIVSSATPSTPDGAIAWHDHLAVPRYSLHLTTIDSESNFLMGGLPRRRRNSPRVCARR
jgi:hypothetical protein